LWFEYCLGGIALDEAARPNLTKARNAAAESNESFPLMAIARHKAELAAELRVLPSAIDIIVRF